MIVNNQQFNYFPGHGDATDGSEEITVRECLIGIESVAVFN